MLSTNAEENLFLLSSHSPRLIELAGVRPFSLFPFHLFAYMTKTKMPGHFLVEEGMAKLCMHARVWMRVWCGIQRLSIFHFSLADPQEAVAIGPLRSACTNIVFHPSSFFARRSTILLSGLRFQCPSVRPNEFRRSCDVCRFSAFGRSFDGLCIGHVAFPPSISVSLMPGTLLVIRLTPHQS